MRGTLRLRSGRGRLSKTFQRLFQWRNLSSLSTKRAGFAVFLVCLGMLMFLQHSWSEKVFERIPENAQQWNFEWGLLEGPFMCDIDGSGTNIINNVLTQSGGGGMGSNILEGSPTCPDSHRDAYLDIVLQFPRNLNIPFYRQMEYVNALLCNIAQKPVRRINLLQEEGGTSKDFLNFLQTQVNKLQGHGSKVYRKLTRFLAQDPCGKIHVVPLGSRITYKAAVQYVNENSAGKPVILTNADISLSSGFESETFVRALTRNNRVHLISRYENGLCPNFPLNSNHAWCNCNPTLNCFDTFLMSPPLPVDYESIDFYLGGLWNSEDVFAGRLVEKGIRISNPCLALRLKHHHCSDWRGNQAEDKQGNEIHLNDIVEQGWKDGENKPKFMELADITQLWANGVTR